MWVIIWIAASVTMPIIFGHKLASQIAGLLTSRLRPRVFQQSSAVMDRQYYSIVCDYPVDNTIALHYNYPDTILTNFRNYSTQHWIIA